MADVMQIAAGVGLGVLTIMGMLYAGGILNNSLNDSNVGTVWSNTVSFFTNFTAKLADAGTVLGVVLILGLFAIAGFWTYNRMRTL